MRYLTGEELLKIHSRITDATGGSHGVREAGLLVSLVIRPQAQFGSTDVHVSLFQKAAALGEALVNEHVFIDGNKRTAFVSMARFLSMHGWEVFGSQEEVVQTMIGVAEKREDVDALAAWLEKHSVKR